MAMYENAKSTVNINGTIGTLSRLVFTKAPFFAFYHSTRSTFKGIQNRASLGVTMQMTLFGSYYADDLI